MTIHRKFDLTGDKVGRLTVLSPEHFDYRGKRLAGWRCKCDCGNEVVERTSFLLRKLRVSCGLCIREERVRVERLDRHSARIGEVNGRLTIKAVTTKFKKNGQPIPAFICDCQCGNTVTLPAMAMKRKFASCGCWWRELVSQRSIRHGQSGDLGDGRFQIYYGMRARCNNPKNIGYQKYGGRGITVCERWMNGEGGLSGFECFSSDVGPRPSPRHSIDRIDNDGNYEPGNVQWATKKQQAVNRSSTKIFEFKGQLLKIEEICDQTGISKSLFRSRIRKGLTAEMAVSAGPSKRTSSTGRAA